MKKLKFRTLAILITSLLFLTLVGCGSSSKSAAVISDTDAVAADFESLEILFGGEDTSPNGVTTTLPLTTTGANGSTITWSSTNTAVIANDGTVVRPVFGSGDATITLTATIIRGDVTETKTFEVVVLEAPQTAAEAVAADKASLVDRTILGLISINADVNNVKGNLTLGTAGACGTTISWVSDNAAVNAATGAITRALYTENDITVILTATISKTGTASLTKEFTIIVLKIPATDEQAVADDTLSLVSADIKGDNVDLSHVIGNLTIPLPSSGLSETTITWSSDTPSVIANDGTVVRPAYGSDDAIVIMTATISKGTATPETKDFTITVLETPQTDAEAIAADKAALTISNFTFTSPDVQSSVTQQFTVVTSGASGTSFAWSSDNSAISFSGGTATVVRPDLGSTTVNVTATITKNAATAATKVFALTVVGVVQGDK